jgi:acyl-CoA thioesterase-1
VPALLTTLAVASAGCGGPSSGQAGSAADDGPSASTSPAGPGARPVAVFLGDSYTAASDHGGGYALRTAEALGWTPVLEAVNGTGYVAAGGSSGGAPYGDRLAAVVADQPAVVVVQGSTNDVGSPVAAVGAAATTLYADLRARLPDAEVVVLGPTSPPGVDPAGLLAVRDVLEGAAAGAGLRFIDPVARGWLMPPDGLYGDPVHPNDTGYADLADDLAAALRTDGS